MSELTRDELLVLLIEECGEVIQAATKCLRFGYDVDHGTGYGNNRDHLSTEYGELAAVSEELELHRGQPFWQGWANKIRRAKDAKKQFAKMTGADCEGSN